MKKCIWFDADGVLADLSKGLATLDGYEDIVQWFIHECPEGNYLKSMERNIDKGCFLHCPPMENYHEMRKLMKRMKYDGYKINILTSCMDNHISDKVTEQKFGWFKKFFTNLYDEMYVVRGSVLKVDYINGDDILIDDYIKTRDQFVKCGKGDNFILYRNYNDFVKELSNKLKVDYME